MKNYSKYMSYFWLLLFFVTASMVTYKGFTEGWGKWYFYYGFSLLCLLWFFIRRKRAQHIEAENEKESQ